MLVADIAGQIDENIGSMFIGLVFSSILLGVSLVQTYYYYDAYPKDAWYLKSLVAITAVFDTVHTGLVTHAIYYYCISNFNKPNELERLVWSVVIEALFTGVTGCLVQLFYLQRIWRLSKKNWILTGSILLLVLADAACGTVWVILAIQCDTYQQLLDIKAITVTINALSTAADVMIAGALCWMLTRARTGFKKSDSMINKLILFVVNTGILTTACACASLIALIASPSTLIYASFYFCIGRLYTNSLLATLNARKTISGNVENNSHMLVSMPSTLLNSMHQHGGKGQKKDTGIAIRIDTTTIQETGDNLDVPSNRRDLDSKSALSDSEEGHFVNRSTGVTQTAATHRTSKEKDSLESDPSYT